MIYATLLLTEAALPAGENVALPVRPSIAATYRYLNKYKLHILSCFVHFGRFWNRFLTQIHTRKLRIRKEFP